MALDSILSNRISILILHYHDPHSLQVLTINNLRLLLVGCQMPLHDIPEHTLSVCLHDISMTRDDTVKIPPINLAHTLVETRPVPGADPVPDEAALPSQRAASRALHRSDESA